MGDSKGYTLPGSDPKEHVKLMVDNDNGDDIYWGHWYKYTDGIVVKTDRTDESRGTVYGGAKRYDVKPDSDVATATYTGTADVHLYYKRGEGKWTHGSAAADFELTANFKAGMIGGNVTGIADVTSGTASSKDDDIRLKDTAIGSDGTFGDDATFMETTGRQTGEWNGAFYNERGVSADKDNVPGFVAGQFSVTKETAEVGKNHLTVHGAFGAAD